MTGAAGTNGNLDPGQNPAIQPGYGGQGGTQTAGGAGGNNDLGCGAGFDGDYDADLNQVIAGIGGDAGDTCAYGAGGGGGGYHGGGGGQSATGGSSGSGGGGGGSSFAVADATGVSITQGDHAGDGVVTISWIVCQPPTITSLTATPRVLWPPNGRMVPVTLSDIVSNGCGAVSCKIISVTSSEPTDPEGDWQITGDLTLNLRAARIGTRGEILNGRVYTITVQCTDASNNTATKTITVLVPLDSPSLPN